MKCLVLLKIWVKRFPVPAGVPNLLPIVEVASRALIIHAKIDDGGTAEPFATSPVVGTIGCKGLNATVRAKTEKEDQCHASRERVLIGETG